MEYVLILQLAATGKEFSFCKDHVCIGRDAACDLPLPGESRISRRHATVFYRNRSWFLTDNGSTNGTALNGRQLAPGEEAKLTAGDEIVLAKEVTIRLLQAVVPEPPAKPEIPAKDESSAFCKVCGSRVSGGFCTHCGSRVGSAPVKTDFPKIPLPPVSESAANSSRKFCRFCGSIIDGMFCSGCGNMANAEPRPNRSVSAYPPRPAASASRPAAACPPPPTLACASAASAKGVVKAKEPFFRSLFRRKEKEEAPEIDDIQFRAAAPAALNPGEYFAVKIMMYREDDYARADREQMTVADRVKAATSSIFQAKRKETYRISLQSPDIPMDTESAELTWNGTYAAADFDVLLPEGYDRRQLRLTARVYCGIAVLTDLKLILQVEAAKQQELQLEKCSLRSAFISYASQDREKVVARIQGIQLSCPDMDLFFDAESLRRGEQWETRLYREIEQRDLFYLFWSRNAAKSEWVAKELAYAMEKKGATAVEPVPLEEPSVCPPPESLQDRHFNDWTLRYLSK
jgi:hypothetical protein